MAEFVDRAVVIETIREEVCRQMAGLGLHRIHVEDAIMKIPAADATRKWIPVTERLPSREGRYITAFSKGEVGENVFMIFRGAPAKWYYNSEDTGEVTHWMPLPEPPKGEMEKT